MKCGTARSFISVLAFKLDRPGRMARATAVLFLFFIPHQVQASERPSKAQPYLPAFIFKNDPSTVIPQIQELVKSEYIGEPPLPSENNPQAVEDQPPPVKKEGALERCGDKIFGIEFLCDPAWTMQFTDDSIIMLISRDPEVSLMIAKMPSKYISLEQIRMADLMDMKQYAEGFKSEWVTLGKERALMVKAFSRSVPPKRVTDYFLIKDRTMYTVLFSVSPAEKWDQYKFIIKQIADSFQYIDPKNVDWRNL